MSFAIFPKGTKFITPKGFERTIQFEGIILRKEDFDKWHQRESKEIIVGERYNLEEFENK